MDYSLDLYTYRVSCRVSGAGKMGSGCRYEEVDRMWCPDRDLDCKLEELRVEGKTLSELQVTQWLVQLLLGVDYMHQR
ncbi:hypothetical protein NFI96_004447 [Prochilodus magdalenae]|nr:hypothetical protein NFI96_004447 [Prochilodus magdalenae]